MSKDFVGCSVLKKYYCQLHFLSSRFPLFEQRHDDSSSDLIFTWSVPFFHSKRFLVFCFIQLSVEQDLWKREIFLHSLVARARTRIFGMTAVFLRFLLHFTLYFRNPVDATLARLSNFRYSRWPPANGRTIQLNIMLLSYCIIMQFLNQYRR